MPTRLTRTMKLAEKKYMMNSRGFLRRKDPMRVSMPKIRKKSEKKAIRMFFPHQRHKSIVPIFRRSFKQLDINLKKTICLLISIVKDRDN